MVEKTVDKSSKIVLSGMNGKKSTPFLLYNAYRIRKKFEKIFAAGMREGTKRPARRSPGRMPPLPKESYNWR